MNKNKSVSHERIRTWTRFEKDSVSVKLMGNGLINESFDLTYFVIQASRFCVRVCTQLSGVKRETYT